jgi:Mu transposase, C-terminal.
MNIKKIELDQLEGYVGKYVAVKFDIDDIVSVEVMKLENIARDSKNVLLVYFSEYGYIDPAGDDVEFYTSDEFEAAQAAFWQAADELERELNG